MSTNVEKVAPVFELGEGPHWDVRSQKLFYVDITGQAIKRFDPLTGILTSAYINYGLVSIVVPVEGTTDRLIVACGRDIILVTWDGESDNSDPPIEKLASLDTDRNDTRLNDGKCDSSGRFWAGTMALPIKGDVPKNRGALYVMDEDMKPEKVVSPISIGNGLAWNSNDDIMYYIDSPTYQIWAYDFNSIDGTIGNKRVIFDLAKNNIKGLPDGMTIDTDDNLWVALFDGGAIIQVNPKTGKLLRTISLPVDKITSVTFGGPLLDNLYVTSAYIDMSHEDRKKKPDSGALFVITGLGVRGHVANNFRYN